MVLGTNLHSIQKASLHVDMDNTDIVQSYEAGECFANSPEIYSLSCLTPQVKLKEGVEYADITPLPMAFQLDENILVRTLTPQTGEGGPASLTYYPDFTVDGWDNGTTTWTWAGEEDSNDSSAFLRIFVSQQSDMFTVISWKMG